MLYSVKAVSLATQENPVNKVFFVIKKKVCKKASDRNRIKRIARHAYRGSIKNIGQTPSKTLIFFLEHDMIREEYSHIVSKMTADIANIITHK